MANLSQEKAAELLESVLDRSQEPQSPGDQGFPREPLIPLIKEYSLNHNIKPYMI